MAGVVERYDQITDGLAGDLPRRLRGIDGPQATLTLLDKAAERIEVLASDIAIRELAGTRSREDCMERMISSFGTVASWLTPTERRYLAAIALDAITDGESITIDGPDIP